MTDREKQPSETRSDNNTVTVEEKLAACERARDEYLDGWKRAKADLSNYKKEELARFEAMLQFGSEALIRELLPVLDSFDLALASVGEKNPAKQGIRMIQGQYLDVLSRAGVEAIPVAPGDPFDPSRHEAVGEATAAGPPDTVAEVVGRGYVLHEKVIRAARVVVSKGPEKET